MVSSASKLASKLEGDGMEVRAMSGCSESNVVIMVCRIDWWVEKSRRYLLLRLKPTSIWGGVC